MEVRQFRTALYFLLAMGLTGFALATQTTGLWVLSMGGLIANAWLIKTNRFAPLSRVTATLLTLLAVLYVVRQYRLGETTIIYVGEFLVMLHLVKLYEQRANRDYAQLLVLSLLLMSSAAIGTASLLFGILMVIYLLASLYCSLLFHLKVESDAAAAAAARAMPQAGTPPEAINPAVLRQDQRRLASSMRLLTGMISTVSLGMGVAVFLFFPRGAPGDLFGHRFPQPQTLTGFNDHVSMDQVAVINQSDQTIAAVRVTQHDKPWQGDRPLLLRGVALDVYTGNIERTPRSPPPFQWERISDEGDTREAYANSGAFTALDRGLSTDTSDTFVQEIDLQPTGSNFMPAMAGAQAVKTDHGMHVSYLRRASAIQGASNDMMGSVHYWVSSTDRLPIALGEEGVAFREGWTSQSNIDPRVRAYAMRPDVSGTDATGRSLALLRGTADAPPDVDRLIAVAIERHLRSSPFQYTLDLTGVREEMESDDPIVVFLYRVKRGHCEYFAGAMTLLCQSLGIESRMVLGYRCDTFNSVGQIYIVKQSEAHAWVEARTNKGWETFDPTAAADAATSSDAVGWFGRIKSLINYLQYEWSASVVAYGQENQRDIMQAFNVSLTNTAERSTQRLAQVPTMFDNLLDKLSDMIDNPTPISVLATLMVITMAGGVGCYAWEKLRLRRRAWRIGLWDLPNRQRQQLAKELGFYDDMVRLLERHGLSRRPNWTPMEFSDGLAFLPHQAYHDVRRLTRLFYRVRYGRAQLNARRRHRLYNAIARIEAMLP